MILQLNHAGVRLDRRATPHECDGQLKEIDLIDR